MFEYVCMIWAFSSFDDGTYSTIPLSKGSRDFFKEKIHFWYQMACSGHVNTPEVVGYFDFDSTHLS